MRKALLIALFVISTCFGFSQQVETSRYEVTRWGKDQDCHFESFQEQGGMMVSETEKTDEDKNRLWNFVALDSSLYETRSDLIPLPQRMEFYDSKSSSQWAVFVFLSEKKQRSDSIGIMVVTYHRPTKEFSTYSDRLPAKSSLMSMALLDNSLMLAVNLRTGNGFLVHYDLGVSRERTITPNINNDFVLFQLDADPKEDVFVLAAREYVDKRYKASSFFVFSKEGITLQSHRFENGENAGLGRMCFSFDESRHLVVYATLERETNRKVDVEGVTEDFSRIAVGVTWVKFNAQGNQVKTYLFKNFPEIDKALTASDRVRVHEEQLKMKQGKKTEQGEIAFQFLAPRLVDYGDRQVFVAEAFRPIFHTETRMDFGYYGTYPVYYTIFDGYDFFSEILMTFDAEGELKWYTSVRFENELCEKLFSHAVEAVCYDELVVASPSRNTLRYEVFDRDGVLLLDQQTVKLDFMYRADIFEDEYWVGIRPWYGSRFLVHGCQIIQNGTRRVTRRTVDYVQKVQFD